MTATEDRWYVDEHGDLINTAGGSICTLIGESADLFRSALDNEYTRRNLPDGVELHRDGTLWALGRNIPDGWERRRDAAEWWTVARSAVGHYWYEVRPPQEPPTVRVPWWEAEGRTTPNGLTIGSEAVRNTCHPDGAVLAGSVWVRADADGTVEVLA